MKIWTLAARATCITLLTLSVASCADDGNSDLNFAGPSGGTGAAVNSSYAALLPVGEYLYAVAGDELVTFSLQDASNPSEIDRQDLGATGETIFFLAGNLFVGGPTGTFTYSIENDGVPLRRGQFEYNTLELPVEPCDPVIATGDVAYATLYTEALSGGPCGRTEFVELLVVMDVSNLDAPQLVQTLTTPTPRGLALDEERGLLFVCNEFSGVSIFDTQDDPRNPVLIQRDAEVIAYDAIANDGTLIVVGQGTLQQFDYSVPSNLVSLSTIALP